MVSLYFCDHKILMCPNNHARSGGSMEVEPAYLVSIDSEELGSRILQCATIAAEIDVLPPAMKGYKQPVLKLSGVGARTFKDLLRKFKFIRVTILNETYCFYSFKNGGDKVGYVEDGQPVRSIKTITAEKNPGAVADLVRSMFLAVQ